MDYISATAKPGWTTSDVGLTDDRAARHWYERQHANKLVLLTALYTPLLSEAV